MQPCQVVGVDIGGTFIDYVAIQQDGSVVTHKHLSDPNDLARAFLAGLAAVAPSGTERLVHGTTVATNALLERRGVKTGAVSTGGFADVLAIGRQNRPGLYSFSSTRQPPLVPALLRLEVDERVDATGNVLLELDEATVKAVADALSRARVEAVAVSLLFSFAHPDHEQRVGAILRDALPGVFVCLSSDVLPEFREYERTSTTVATAYVGPLIRRYIDKVIDQVNGEFQVMQSNGGVIAADEAAARGAALVLSGPAGGVVGAFDASRRRGITAVLTFDMGGTSTDVALCPGRILGTAETEVAGVPIRLPMIDIHTVGAGGGSIAYRDAGGALRVGPESAGANPGPACYGKGELPTVTDADVVLGRIPAASFLGGRLPLDRERAVTAIEALGAELGLGVEAAALGILRVVHASMQRAIRRVSVERGHDPRQFTLVAFGGAGPQHAAELAEELEISRVLVPQYPGVESAMGMATADELRDYSKTVKLTLTPDVGTHRLDGLWAQLEERVPKRDGMRFERSADLRYVGQSFEIEVDASDTSGLGRRFEVAHERLYGFNEPGRAIELITVRLRARTPRSVALAADLRHAAWHEEAASIRFREGWLKARRLQRDALGTGDGVDGPALVLQPDTATLVPPGWLATADEFGNLVLERQ